MPIYFSIYIFETDHKNTPGRVRVQTRSYSTNKKHRCINTYILVCDQNSWLKLRKNFNWFVQLWMELNYHQSTKIDTSM
jgi:hypothetical protein